jgi:hypothetical protein
MKYSKYIGIIIIIILTNVLFLSTITEATPPRFIGLQYDKNTNVLKVIISHLSPARSFHYIYRIVIQKNGVIEQVHFYNKQPGFLFNRYEFNISAEPGDQITVSAFCILFGYNTRSIIIT